MEFPSGSISVNLLAINAPYSAPSRGLGRFIELPKTGEAPDEPAISDEAIPRLQTLSDSVIEIVEARIDAGEDKSAVQRELASAVYEIRQEFERVDRVDRWRRGAGRGPV